MTNLTYAATDDSVTITNANGTCITADYAICTFSIGVLQTPPADEGGVAFDPPLPTWKRTAINESQMGTFTKIFLQFTTPFWDTSKQFSLYADPIRRGHYALFQNLDHPDFLPGSGIIFITLAGRPLAWQGDDKLEHVARVSPVIVLSHRHSLWDSITPRRGRDRFRPYACHWRIKTSCRLAHLLALL